MSSRNWQTVQSPEVIDRLLKETDDLESQALLLHEAVIRSKLVSGSSVSDRIVERLKEEKHPLASLPLFLFELENTVDLPDYDMEGESRSAPKPFREEAGCVLPKVEKNITTAETTTPGRSECIASAVKNWKDESNGRFEARTFTVDLSSQESIAPFLPYIGLECLDPSDAWKSRDRAPVNKIFQMLFFSCV